MNKNPLLRYSRPCILIGSAIIAFLVLLIYAVKVWQSTANTDFGVYYRAAERIKNYQWNEIYSLRDGPTPFRYPPLLLPLFRPFAELSVATAHRVWFFLQFFFFACGFYFLNQSLKLCQRPSSSGFNSGPVTCLAMLYVLRFCLDTFTIGQVSSLMFLGFAVGLYGWMTRRPVLSTTGILVPTLFKIGPGILFGIFLSAFETPAILLTASGAFIGGIAVLLGISGIFLTFTTQHPFIVFSQLWQSWSTIVANDSHYYDASHYGSQSLKSFLLRAVQWRWMDAQLAQTLYWTLAVTICGILGLFWFFRRPCSALGRGLFFSLGIFPYLWFMPETFKYSLTPLAIPVAFLMLSPRRPLFSLAFGAFFLSLAGKDLVGDWIFFESQLHSLPFLATLFLGASTLKLAWRESALSGFESSDDDSGHSKSPCVDFCPSRDREISLILPELPSKMVQTTETGLSEFLARYEPGAVEIIRSKSMKEGFLQSRGKKILFSFEAAFSEDAVKALDQGFDLVRGVKRGAKLKWIHFWLPFKTQNPQSHFLAFHWKAAAQVFAVQKTSSSLELSLAAQTHGLKEKELPVLSSGSTLSTDCTSLRGWVVLAIAWRYRQGYYHPCPTLSAMTADDWGLSPGVNQGILRLAQQGIVRRVSCMANGLYLEEGLSELRALPQIQIGLHWNLTYGKPFQTSGGEGLITPSPARWMLGWLNPFTDRAAKRDYVRRELQSQIQKLKSLGLKVDYLDGHHHIHLVPGLMDAVADILHAEGISVVRLPYDLSLALSAQMPIVVLSALAHPKWKQHRLKSLPCIYPNPSYFEDHGKLRALLAKNAHCEIIVHPAAVDDLGSLKIPDPYTSGRVVEYQSLRMLRV